MSYSTNKLTEQIAHKFGIGTARAQHLAQKMGDLSPDTDPNYWQKIERIFHFLRRHDPQFMSRQDFRAWAWREFISDMIFCILFGAAVGAGGGALLSKCLDHFDWNWCLLGGIGGAIILAMLAWSELVVTLGKRLQIADEDPEMDDT